jgi:hypothetical protein
MTDNELIATLKFNNLQLRIAIDSLPHHRDCTFREGGRVCGVIGAPVAPQPCNCWKTFAQTFKDPDDDLTHYADTQPTSTENP